MIRVDQDHMALFGDARWHSLAGMTDAPSKHGNNPLYHFPTDGRPVIRGSDDQGRGQARELFEALGSQGQTPGAEAGPEAQRVQVERVVVPAGFAQSVKPDIVVDQASDGCCRHVGDGSKAQAIGSAEQASPRNRHKLVLQQCWIP